MKIGIMTFIDYRNYGNRLQNYALQKILQDYFDADVETIVHDKYRDYHFMDNYYKQFPMHIARSVFWWIHDFFVKDNRALGYIWQSDELTQKRIKKNMAFTDQYIKESDFIIHEGNLQKKKMQQFDIVFSGSDQVWNPTMDGAATELYFLRMIPYDKRASFAASIGVENIPDDKLEQWTKYLNGMKYVSVREKSAQEIVAKTSDKTAELLLDPTMIVDTRVWYDIMNEHHTQLPERYIVTYILGELSKEDEESLENLAVEMDCVIIRLNDKKYEEIFAFDAVDFLNSLCQAQIVITDSFHACVFSILFQKEFYVLKRKGEYEDIFSRISDLLVKMECVNSVISCIEDVPSCRQKETKEKKYQETIIKERQRAHRYLNEICIKTNK